MSELTAPEDETMPQLRTLWNGAAMSAILAAALRPEDGGAAWIRGCRVERVRYRAGERSIILYALDVEERGGGRRRVWATASTYPDTRGERYHRQLAAAAAAIPAALLPLAAMAYLPSLRALVQVFPLDRHLPSLPALFQDHADLRPLVMAAFGPGAWRILRWSAEPVRYRPALGAAVRIVVEAEAAGECTEVQAGRRTSRIVFAKVYRDDEGGVVHENLCTLEAACRRRRDRFSPVHSLGWSPPLRVLVLAQAPGRSLESLLLAGEKEPLLKALGSTARALANVHRSPRAGRSRVTKEDMLELTATAVRFISLSIPELRKKAEAVLEALRGQLIDVTPAPAHFDRKDEHVFVDAEHFTFIDLDSMAEGDPVFDPAMLAARLRVLPVQQPVPPPSSRLRSRRFSKATSAGCPVPGMSACRSISPAQHSRWRSTSSNTPWGIGRPRRPDWSTMPRRRFWAMFASTRSVARLARRTMGIGEEPISTVTGKCWCRHVQLTICSTLFATNLIAYYAIGTGVTGQFHIDIRGVRQRKAECTDPLGVSGDIGDELDLVLALREWRHVELMLKVSRFTPGAAFASNRRDPAHAVEFGVTVNF